jgi:hypothetical protein
MELRNKYRKQLKQILETGLNKTYKEFKKEIPISVRESYNYATGNYFYSINLELSDLNLYMYNNNYTEEQFNRIWSKLLNWEKQLIKGYIWSSQGFGNEFTIKK